MPFDLPASSVGGHVDAGAAMTCLSLQCPDVVRQFLVWIVKKRWFPD
jgi:hypothetical protein